MTQRRMIEEAVTRARTRAEGVSLAFAACRGDSPHRDEAFVSAFLANVESNIKIAFARPSVRPRAGPLARFSRIIGQ
jgi:hypothetical protein